MDDLEFDITIVYLPSWALKSFRQLAVPICRAHGYDDVLPEVPDSCKGHQYILIRGPAGKPIKRTATAVLMP